MGDDRKIENALYAVHSRLGVIEGKVNLVARAERESLLALLEKTVRKDHLIGQIYLLLDGNRSQKEVHEALVAAGVDKSQPTVSRRMTLMETEHGIVELVQGGNTSVYRKDAAMEKVLNLAQNVRKWLEAEGAVVPEQAARRRRRGGAK